MASNTAARFLNQGKLSLSRSTAAAVRALSTAPKSGYTHDESIPANYTIDSVKPPQYWNKPDGEFLFHKEKSFLFLYCGEPMNLVNFSQRVPY